jgi:predicted dinucleotide-binding enzyme
VLIGRLKVQNKFDRKIGIIGAGRLGTALARALLKAGYKVSIINSRDKSSLALQVQILLPGVIAQNITELIEWSNVIILAVPLPRFKQLPLTAMSGRIIIDAMNYWAAVDGKLPEFDEYAGSSSELVARFIPNANVVKTLNSVAYGEIEEHGLPEGSEKRRGIPLAGNSDKAKQVAAEIVSAIGFDPVDIGDLKQGTQFQPDSKLFNQRYTKSQIIHIIAST